MAWTITETVRVSKMKSQQGDELIEVKLDCASDANATDYDLSAAAMGAVKGSWLYAVKIVPGTGGDIPDAVFDLDIEDENNIHILDTDANPVAPTGGATYHMGSATMGVYPPIGSHSGSQVSVVCATLGNGKDADIYLYFVK